MAPRVGGLAMRRNMPLLGSVPAMGYGYKCHRSPPPWTRGAAALAAVGIGTMLQRVRFATVQPGVVQGKLPWLEGSGAVVVISPDS